MDPSAATGGRKGRPWARSRRGWWYASVNILTASGLVAALAQWGWPGPTAAVLSIAVLTVVVAAIVLPGDGLRVVLREVWMGLLLGAVVTAAVGLVSMFGVLGWLPIVVLAATTPGLRTAPGRLWRRVRHREEPVVAEPSPIHTSPPPVREPTVRVVPTVTPEDLTSLDDESLCLAWRRSFLDLESAATLRQRMAVVDHRQRCLDELQRRSPQGVAAWLSSGARASGNPLPYLEGRGPKSA